MLYFLKVKENIRESLCSQYMQKFRESSRKSFCS